MGEARRMDGETFEDYKARRRVENKALKHRLKGRFAWISSILVPDFKDKKKLRKLNVRGTYVKPKKNSD